MARSYSDPSYGSKKILRMNATGSTVGTAVGTNLAASRTTVEMPITVQDWQLKYIAGGTSTVKSLLINSSLAGTGANVALGTIALGTNATGEVRDGGALNANLNAGDDLIITFTGTDSIVADVVAEVTYVERYVQSDS
jgi:hypothetical protein